MTSEELEHLRQKAGTLRVEAQEHYRQDRAPQALALLVEATQIEKTLHTHQVKQLPAPVAEERKPYTPNYQWNPEEQVSREHHIGGKKVMPNPQGMFSF